MSYLETTMRTAGILQIALGSAHACFPGPLRWREDLRQLSPVNRQIFWVHTYFIVLILFLFGCLALFGTAELLEPSSLARAVLGGHVIFWGFRLYAQHFIYNAELWRGHKLYTVMHCLFTMIWVFLTAVYVWALYYQFFP